MVVGEMAHSVGVGGSRSEEIKIYSLFCACILLTVSSIGS